MNNSKMTVKISKTASFEINDVACLYRSSNKCSFEDSLNKLLVVNEKQNTKQSVCDNNLSEDPIEILKRARMEARTSNIRLNNINKKKGEFK